MNYLRAPFYFDDIIDNECNQSAKKVKLLEEELDKEKKKYENEKQRNKNTRRMLQLLKEKIEKEFKKNMKKYNTDKIKIHFAEYMHFSNSDISPYYIVRLGVCGYYFNEEQFKELETIINKLFSHTPCYTLEYEHIYSYTRTTTNYYVVIDPTKIINMKTKKIYVEDA